MSVSKSVQLGLCCMNMTLKSEHNVYASRKIIMKIIQEKGLKELKRRITLNMIKIT